MNVRDKKMVGGLLEDPFSNVKGGSVKDLAEEEVDEAEEIRATRWK